MVHTSGFAAIPQTQQLSPDEKFMLAAYSAAWQSTDSNTKNGALIIVGNNIITGFNGLLEGVEPLEERMVSPAKYDWYEHAERSALYAALRSGVSVSGGIMYSPWAACADCARGIVLSGIKKLFVHKQRMDITPDRWVETIVTAHTMLREAGVDIEYIDCNFGIKIIADGRMVEL